MINIGSVRSIEQGEEEDDDDDDDDDVELPLDERSSLSSISHSCKK